MRSFSTELGEFLERKEKDFTLIKQYEYKHHMPKILVGTFCVQPVSCLAIRGLNRIGILIEQWGKVRRSVSCSWFSTLLFSAHPKRKSAVGSKCSGEVSRHILVLKLTLILCLNVQLFRVGCSMDALDMTETKTSSGKYLSTFLSLEIYQSHPHRRSVCHICV